MAKKPAKPARKTFALGKKISDLTPRRNPKGGAQKKEGPNMEGSTRGGSRLRPEKSRLS